MLSLDDLQPVEHQAAGHAGCLSSGDGAVFAKLTNQQEMDFYNAMTEQQQEDSPLGSLLSDWMPKYLGTLIPGLVDSLVDVDLGGKQYIVLQNLLYGFKNPSILDIKLGSVLTDDTVTAEKAKRLQDVSDSTTSGSLGLRVCGMKLFIGDSTDIPSEIYPEMSKSIELVKTPAGNYLQFDKFFGRSLTKETIKQGLLLFFSHGSEFMTKSLINRFHQRLQLVYNCLLSAEVRIVSGSLFFIYENHPDAWKSVDAHTYEERDPLLRSDFISEEDDDEEAEEEDTPLSALNVIDFAHAKYVKGQGYDENVLNGLQSLLDIFEELL